MLLSVVKGWRSAHARNLGDGLVLVEMVSFSAC